MYWFHEDSVGSIPDITTFEKNGLKIVFSFHGPNPADPSAVSITLKPSNSNLTPLSQFLFQATVPKVDMLHETCVLACSMLCDMNVVDT